MQKMHLLSQFGKGNANANGTKTRNAVIYTRVSSKEQAENLSLETQLKGCKTFAVKSGLNVLECFGGTYESAKSDDRKEFNRMLAYVEKSKEHIGYIIVYSLERFSRTGDGAISIASQLKKRGITVLSATQPIDSSNPSGNLQQNMLFLFSQFDNELRKQKCIAGMKEKMRKGEWVGVAPVGYSYDRSERNVQKIVINEKGRLIKKMFEWKAYKKLSNSQIADQATKMGFAVNRKRVSEILGNTFYCGFLTHNLLDGEVVKGKHPALISEELFLLANGVIRESKRNVSGYKHSNLNENVPLRHFATCAHCGKPLTAYIVKKKNLHYYKCNTVGCKSNKSARDMHHLFKDLLNVYRIEHKYVSPLKEYLIDLYHSRITDNKADATEIKSKITVIDKRLETVTERYAYGEIDQEVFAKTSSKLKQEKQDLESNLDSSLTELSNPEQVIERAVENLSNLVNLWDSGALEVKTDLQNLLFPKGVQYDRKNNTYRTTEINEVIAVTHSFTAHLEQNKKGQTSEGTDLSASVVPTGIEPVSKV